MKKLPFALNQVLKMGFKFLIRKFLWCKHDYLTSVFRYQEPYSTGIFRTDFARSKVSEKLCATRTKIAHTRRSHAKPRKTISCHAIVECCLTEKLKNSVKFLLKINFATLGFWGSAEFINAFPIEVMIYHLEQIKFKKSR